MEDLLGIKREAVYDARLYRTLDRLLPYKRELEVHLKRRLGDLFALAYDLLLYDVISRYFEEKRRETPRRNTATVVIVVPTANRFASGWS